MSEKLRAVFLLEQQIGHRTYAENLKRAVSADARIVPTWVPITYAQPGGFWERLTFLPAHWRGTLRGRAQARAGLAQPYAVAFCNTQVPAALAGAKIFRQPYVVSTDITPAQYDRMGERYGHRADRLAILRAYKHCANMRVFQNAARVLPWSTWVAESLVAEYGVDAARIEVAPPGVDVEQWSPRAEKPGDGRLRLLFVGGDLYRKGGATLLAAFAELQRVRGDQVELHMVTRSPAPQAGGVIGHYDLQANDPRLVALYQQCDVFVLPTEAEAFGIAAIEASATGLPVIATRVGGLPDVVRDGETGFLINPGDTRDLVARINILADDVALRQRLGAAARAHAVEKFNATKNAARIVEILLQAGK